MRSSIAASHQRPCTSHTHPLRPDPLRIHFRPRCEVIERDQLIPQHHPPKRPPQPHVQLKQRSFLVRSPLHRFQRPRRPLPLALPVEIVIYADYHVSLLTGSAATSCEVGSYPNMFSCCWSGRASSESPDAAAVRPREWRCTRAPPNRRRCGTRTSRSASHPSCPRPQSALLPVTALAASLPATAQQCSTPLCAGPSNSLQ